MEDHKFIENDEGWVHLTVGEETYLTSCPHCRPSYLTYNPEVSEAQFLCVNAFSDLCKQCFEPGCDLAGCESIDSDSLRTEQK